MVGPLLRHPCVPRGAPQVVLGPRLARPAPWPQAAPADLRAGARENNLRLLSADGCIAAPRPRAAADSQAWPSSQRRQGAPRAPMAPPG